VRIGARPGRYRVECLEAVAREYQEHLGVRGRAAELDELLAVATAILPAISANTPSGLASRRMPCATSSSLM
jgi:hypothetical protein